MAKIRLKDNTITSKDDFREVSKVTERIANKTLEQLEKEGIFVFPEIIKEAEDITKDQIILQSINDTFKTGNVMGFLGYENERIVIESRFSTGAQDFFFQYLLEKVLDFPNILNLDTDANQDSRLFNLLLFLFPYYLKSAMRKGIFKTYIRHQYNNSNVKGSIDVSRHIKMNTPFIGNVAYSQREFSYDNYLMELIRHTIEFIKTKAYGNKLLYKVRDEVIMVNESTSKYKYHDRRKVIICNKKNPIQHAYYHEYRALQRLCIMILQHTKHQIGSGIQQIHGILFDGAWLWEEYINSLLLECNVNFYHPMNKKGDGVQWLFTNNKGRLQGKIYPDFISKNSKSRIIADAKYKPSNNIGNKDYLQVLAYMYRFDAKRGYYLYPENGGAEHCELRMNSGSRYEKNVKPREDVQVIKLGLKIPNNVLSFDGNKGFYVKMKASEAEFIKKVKYTNEKSTPDNKE